MVTRKIATVWNAKEQESNKMKMENHVRQNLSEIPLNVRPFMWLRQSSISYNLFANALLVWILNETLLVLHKTITISNISHRLILHLESQFEFWCMTPLHFLSIHFLNNEWLFYFHVLSECITVCLQDHNVYDSWNCIQKEINK